MVARSISTCNMGQEKNIAVVSRLQPRNSAARRCHFCLELPCPLVEVCSSVRFVTLELAQASTFDLDQSPSFGVVVVVDMAQSRAEIDKTVYAAINEVKWLEVETKIGKGSKAFSFNLTFYDSPEQAIR